MKMYCTKKSIFIDFEASSLSLASSYPIEVAVSCGFNSLIEVHSQLIKPLPTWKERSKESENVHGMSQERLHLERK